MLGDKNKSIEWLKKGVKARVPDILSTKYLPAFESLKYDTQFQQILTEMKISQ